MSNPGGAPKDIECRLSKDKTALRSLGNTWSSKQPSGENQSETTQYPTEAGCPLRVRDLENERQGEIQEKFISVSVLKEKSTHILVLCYFDRRAH